MRFLSTLILACGLAAAAEPVQVENTKVFDEPLVSIGSTAPMENKGLEEALASYGSRTNLDDFSALTGFLSSYPQSAWNASLRLHLGVEYYNQGYYSKALDTWQQAWLDFKDVREPKAKAQADRALGELVRMDSKLGLMGDLQQLLDAAKGRPLSGPGTQLLANGTEAFWMMNHHPEICFRCGPMALGRLLAQQDPTKTASPLIVHSASTTNGFSLSQVEDLAQQVGMNYQMAYRSPGAPLVTPAVVNWKVNHYAALLAQRGQRYLVQDPTFHSSLLMTMSALDQEGSGYFLVPAGPLPNGWRTVSLAEGSAVFGKGYTQGPEPGGPGSQGPDSNDGGSCGGPMTVYYMNFAFVSLGLRDTPVGYQPPVGPAVRFTATYNQAEPNQPATFSYSNLGQKWTCNWISYVTDNPNSPGADLSLYQKDGGTLYFGEYNSSTKSYAPELETQAILTMTSPSNYTLMFSNGSMNVFSMSDGSTGNSRRIFLTQVVDPAGNAVTLNYDEQLRITNIVDAIGQPTTFSYTNAQFPNAITSVEDPFGRSAQLQYNSAGLLSQITDIIGLTSSYTYSNDFVTTLQTPYGTSSFSTGQANGTTWLMTADPSGESEYLEFNQTVETGGDLLSTIPHGMGTLDEYLNFRNSFYWDKHAYQVGAGDYTKATIYHFCHYSANQSLSSDIPESIKRPLENRVWYNYPGQAGSQSSIVNGSSSKPSVMGRVLDDGTTQASYYRYNPIGNVTNAIDPIGRNFSYIYASNNVDLLQVAMTRNGNYEVQSNMTYNAQHLPLTITDAAGQTTTKTYNARGEIVSTTDPKGETTNYTYDANGYLLSITGPLQTANDVFSITHDAYGRIRTLTDPVNDSLTFDYDAADRITQVTHSDGTYEQRVYSRLDLVALRDRLGRWTTNTYNADGQVVQRQDPLGRITQIEWCHCGALSAIIDPMGHVTSWDYDVEDRPSAKHYADGSTVSYVYENTTSRLAARWDEKGQERAFRYYPDDNLLQVSYPNAIVSTPAVTFIYDSNYNRVVTMQDGIGTSAYTYYPITTTPTLGAGLLAAVTGPLPNSSVTYQYDELGRLVDRSISGAVQATQYDVLGRPRTVTNALGTFQYAYSDATPRVSTATFPNGQKTVYSYYNDLTDGRLEQIQNLYPNGMGLSSSGYSYNAIGEITAWTNLWDTLGTRLWQPSFDAVDQLTNVASSGGPSPITNYTYAYDPAGNRLVASANGTQIIASYNVLNQLVNRNVPTNDITYEWNAEDRLSAINTGASREEFYYDGRGRRTETIELTNGVVVSNYFYLWCDKEICEQRDATGANVTRRFFGQGEQVVNAGAQPSSASYYYTRDHLGSVREVLDATGALQGRLDYDPYGQPMVLQENFKPDFAYAGYFSDHASGLYLTLHRALDSAIGRWLSRDPSTSPEMLPGGPNLYAYLANSPIWGVDAEGLCPTRNPWNPFDWPGIIGDWWYGISNATWDPATNTWMPATPP